MWIIVGKGKVYRRQLRLDFSEKGNPVHTSVLTGIVGCVCGLLIFVMFLHATANISKKVSRIRLSAY